jgi:hypothetical protein
MDTTFFDENWLFLCAHKFADELAMLWSANSTLCDCFVPGVYVPYGVERFCYCGVWI